MVEATTNGGNSKSPVLTVLASDYEALVSEVTSLRAENQDLKKQLEQAMVLIAGQSSKGSGNDRPQRRSSGGGGGGQGGSKPMRKRALDAAQNLDRDINGGSGESGQPEEGSPPGGDQEHQLMSVTGPI